MLVHGDGKDVLCRVLIVDLEIVGIVVFESIAQVGDSVAVVNHGLPGIHLHAVHGEIDVAPGLSGCGRGVIATEDLGVESQFGQQEIGHRTCQPAIKVAHVVGRGRGELRSNGL